MTPHEAAKMACLIEWGAEGKQEREFFAQISDECKDKYMKHVRSISIYNGCGLQLSPMDAEYPFEWALFNTGYESPVYRDIWNQMKCDFVSDASDGRCQVKSYQSCEDAWVAFFEVVLA